MSIPPIHAHHCYGIGYGKKLLDQYTYWIGQHIKEPITIDSLIDVHAYCRGRSHLEGCKDTITLSTFYLRGDLESTITEQEEFENFTALGLLGSVIINKLTFLEMGNGVVTMYEVRARLFA